MLRLIRATTLIKSKHNKKTNMNINVAEREGKIWIIFCNQTSMQRWSPCKRRELWKENAQWLLWNAKVLGFFIESKPNCFHSTMFQKSSSSQQVTDVRLGTEAVWQTSRNVQAIHYPKTSIWSLLVISSMEQNILRCSLLQQPFTMGCLQVTYFRDRS